MRKFTILPGEPDLVARAADDPSVFATLYNHYLPHLFKYIRSRISDKNEAEELTSKVFELVLAKVSTYCPDKAPFNAWLFTIAHNTLNDYLRTRRQQRFISVELLDEMACTAPQPLEMAIRNENRSNLVKALSHLSDRERNLISLKFAGGLTNSAISEITGLTRSNVAVIIFRAIRRLKADLSR